MNKLTIGLSIILLVFSVSICAGQTGSSFPDSSNYGIPAIIVDNLRWLSEDESPFNLPVFDTRAFATTMLSVTKDKNAAALDTELTQIDGTVYIGQHPEYTQIADAGFAVGLTEPLQDGPVFVSSVMEEKWNIYYFNNSMYFVRSWTGDLIFLAETKKSKNKLVVNRIEYDGRVFNKDYDAIRVVDFLIKSHVFRMLAVAPIPDEIGDNKVEIAMYLFGLYGRVAYCGSRENTIDAALKE